MWLVKRLITSHRFWYDVNLNIVRTTCKYKMYVSYNLKIVHNDLLKTLSFIYINLLLKEKIYLNKVLSISNCWEFDRSIHSWSKCISNLNITRYLMLKNYFFQQISWEKKYYLKTALKTNQCKHNLFLGLNRLLWLVKQLVLHLLNS